MKNLADSKLCHVSCIVYCQVLISGLLGCIGAKDVTNPNKCMVSILSIISADLVLNPTKPKNHRCLFICVVALALIPTMTAKQMLPVGLLTQEVERCTGIAGVTGATPVQAFIFLKFLFAVAKIASTTSSTTVMKFFTFKSCLFYIYGTPFLVNLYSSNF